MPDVQNTGEAMAEKAITLSESSGGLFVWAPFYVLRGALFLRNHRALWKYAAAPVAISIVVLGIAYYLLYRFFVSWVGSLVGEGWYWQVLYYVLVVIVAVFILVGFFFVFTLLATAISAPFNELISEKTEQLVTGGFRDTPFSLFQMLKDSGRGLAHCLRMLGIYLGLLLVSLFLLLVPVIGGILFSAAMVLITAYMLAYEYLGCPMDLRRFSFKQKRLFLRSHFKCTVGFGLGNAALASIPVLNILFIPAAVVGGTLLFLDLTAATGEASELNKR